MAIDKMRAEFESWAESQCLSLTRISWKDGTVSEYAYTETSEAWQVWRSAYQAGAKAERKAFVSKLRSEIDHAALNAMQLKPMFGQSKGDLAVRVSTLEAIIENREGEG